MWVNGSATIARAHPLGVKAGISPPERSSFDWPFKNRPHRHIGLGRPASIPVTDTDVPSKVGGLTMKHQNISIWVRMGPSAQISVLGQKIKPGTVSQAFQSIA